MATWCDPNPNLMIIAFVFSVLTAFALIIEVGFGHRPVVYPVLLLLFLVALMARNANFAERLFGLVCPTAVMKGLFVADVAVVALINMMLPFVSSEASGARYALTFLLICMIALTTAMFMLVRLGKSANDNVQCAALVPLPMTPQSAPQKQVGVSTNFA